MQNLAEREGDEMVADMVPQVKWHAATEDVVVLVPTQVVVDLVSSTTTGTTTGSKI
jgi:hypothetical protein